MQVLEADWIVIKLCGCTEVSRTLMKQLVTDKMLTREMRRTLVLYKTFF